MTDRKEYLREYYKQNKQEKEKKAKERRLKQKYNLTVEEYNNLYIKQKHRCAICLVEEKEAPRQKLFVDHCHVTGNTRGLLCATCNFAIGLFKDDLSLLMRAKKYLTENS